MGNFIIRVDGETDRYIDWNTNIDNAVWVGTRDELVHRDRTSRDAHAASSLLQAIAMADERGSSSMLGTAVWGDPEGTLIAGNFPDIASVFPAADISVPHGMFRLRRRDLDTFYRVLTGELHGSDLERILIPEAVRTS